MTQLTWQQEMNSALKNKDQLDQFFDTSFPALNYPHFIPLRFAQHIKDDLEKNKDKSVLAKQFLPSKQEQDCDHDNDYDYECECDYNEKNIPMGLKDPIGDNLAHVAPGLIHRYYNRVLFLPTSHCPIICRYCFRKNEIAQNDRIFAQAWKKTLTYLDQRKEIEELIFSGGDPFILNDQKLQFYLDELEKIKHLKFIRFHTRAPVILPSRFTSALIQLLRNFQKRTNKKIIIAIHTNHMDEWSCESLEVLKKIEEFTLLSQTVLLKGVNQNPSQLVTLFKFFAQNNVLPYYLHHPDRVRGGMHFYLSLEEGKVIYQEVKKRLSGWMVPKYVQDHPDARGKTIII